MVFGLATAVLSARQTTAQPQLVSQVQPKYTPAAMRARVQGVVGLACVVQVDGTVGDITVEKSLDATFGLDQQAIEALKQWKFKPGTRDGVPVPMKVHANLQFTLRGIPGVPDPPAPAAPTLPWLSRPAPATRTPRPAPAVRPPARPANLTAARTTCS